MLIIHLNAQSTDTRWPNGDAGSDCAIRHLAFIYDIYGCIGVVVEKRENGYFIAR